MNKIVALSKEHLKELISEEIKLNGLQCDLNRIDISKLTDLRFLFQESKFNGDISRWDTSNVERMDFMFYGSEFNGDISNWDTGNVIGMGGMFYESKFNGDVSNWNVRKVRDMKGMFRESAFRGDLSKWETDSLEIGKSSILPIEMKMEDFPNIKMSNKTEEVIETTREIKSMTKIGDNKILVTYK